MGSTGGVRGKVLEWRGGGQHWRSAWEGAGVERGRAALMECVGRCWSGEGAGNTDGVRGATI